jgi:hypothetical protein
MNNYESSNLVGGHIAQGLAESYVEELYAENQSSSVNWHPLRVLHSAAHILDGLRNRMKLNHDLPAGQTMQPRKFNP